VEKGNSAAVAYSTNTLVAVDAEEIEGFVGRLTLSAKPFAVNPDGSKQSSSESLDIVIEVRKCLLHPFIGTLDVAQPNGGGRRAV
jgi:hypothetical protein